MSNRQLFSIALALIAVFVLYQTFYIVDQRERVIKLRFGEVIGVDSQPGVHFKWPIADSVRRMDSRVLTLDNQSEDFLTSEKKSVKVDFYAKWRIQDTRTYYRATAGLRSTPTIVWRRSSIARCGTSFRSARSARWSRTNATTS